jgi:hypothetical protein
MRATVGVRTSMTIVAFVLMLAMLYQLTSLGVVLTLLL